MVIAYIHQYFRTPEQGGCTRSYHLAKGLVAAGHQVEMITAHNSKHEIREIEGIRVHYLPVSYRNEYGFIRRIFSFLKFVRLAKIELDQLHKIDLGYVMTTPLTTGLVGLHLKNKKNVPFYFEVGDLWPEAPVQMGVIKSRILKWLLYSFEKQCYFEAQRIIALSPDIRNYIEKVSPLSKVYVIPNLSHSDYFQAQLSMRSYSNKNPFNIGYIGALGKANGLDHLAEVIAKSHQHNIPVKFHVMGEGAERKSMMRLCKGLPNVTFYPFGSSEKVKSLLEEMDAAYVSFKNIPVLGTGSPNKFFDGLAAGKMIITNFEGWTKDVIEANKCGFYHHPEKPEEFVKRLMPYLENHQLLQQAQKNARRLAEEFYDRKLLVNKLLQAIDNQKSMAIDDSEVYILTA